jgi:hypothetical protein
MRLTAPPILRLSAALFLIVLAAGLAAAADEVHRHDLEADELVLMNLVGHITVERAPGDRYEVEVTVRGDDLEPGLVDVKVDEGRPTRVAVVFPLDEHRTYVYPELGRGSTTVWNPERHGSGSWWNKLWRNLGGEKVTIQGSGRGLEVWADVVLRVPAGRETEVYLAAGAIESSGTEGELLLDTSSGPVAVDGHRGKLVCDTGSGRVTVRDVDGPVLCDTGSGAVEVQDQRGGDLEVDTGSGAVSIDGADVPRLYVDTGSGGVQARRVRADRAEIDTGSGAVELQLDRMGTGRFVIDTGSGGVELTMPRDASATISVDTGSGGIRTDVPGAEILHKERDELKLRVGGGETTVVIDTGSGGVTIAAR